MKLFGLKNQRLIILGFTSIGFAQINYWDVSDPTDTPPTLSAMGIYKASSNGLVKKQMIANAYHYDVNSPLWSDGSHKSRWILLPLGKKVGFDLLNDYYTYPDSAIFIKEFSLDTTVADSRSAIKWETRILYNKKEVLDSTVIPIIIRDHWYAYTYKWDRDQKEARLVDVNLGKEDTLRVYSKDHKTYRYKKWSFPSKIDCRTCHQDYGFSVQGDFLQPRSILGFFTAQLNRQHPDSTSKINQLEDFFKKKILVPVTGQTKPINWDASSIPRWAPIGDTTASIDLRARSYIAANCSGCHSTRGSGASAQGTADLNYEFHTMKPQMEFSQRRIGATVPNDTKPEFYDKNDLASNPDGLDSLPMWSALIVPGYPQKSVLHYKQTLRRDGLSKFEVVGNKRPPDSLFQWFVMPDQMPPLASYEKNEPALKLLADWIIAMPRIPIRIEPPNSIGRNGKKGIGSNLLKVEGRNLYLSSGLAGLKNIKVTITNIKGKTQVLQRVGNGVYAIPEQMERGVYVIRVGAVTFRRYLF